MFVGYPNWWYDMPMAMYSFFDEYDFIGKTIIPFNSHNGSRFSDTIKTIQELEPNANVITDGFTVNERDVPDSARDIAEWINSLGITPVEKSETVTEDITESEPEMEIIEDIPETISEPIEESHNILVCYFSFPETDSTDASSGASRVVINGEMKGAMQYMAEIITDSTDGDLFRIETVQEYPGTHEPLVDFASEEKADSARPELSTHIENLENYDTIFIGYPNWWADMPMPLYTFLEEYDFSGKKIIPFNSHGGSRFSNTIETIAEYEPDVEVIKDGFTVSRDDVANVESDLRNWVQSLGF
ncbi:MAG: flavodoxin [Lachnospiraceae bacterium]|nr:flavodoxin [Lachnospiraceae bacterium]